MKKIICLLLALVCLVLAGCGGDKPGEGAGQTVGQTADQPVMLEYYDRNGGYGIINSEGEMIVPPAQREPDSLLILADDSRRQYFAMEIETLYPPGEAAAEGEYLISGQIFRFYDPWGRLVHEQQIDLPQLAPGSSIEFWLARDGSLENSRFLLSTFAGDGGYHILDVYGRELAASQVIEDWQGLRYASAAMELDRELLVVNADCWFEQEPEVERADFYTLAGEPMAMPRSYQACWRGWDVPAQAQTDYYLARFSDAAGGYVYDLLDAQGQRLLSDLKDAGYSMGAALVVEHDGQRGLLNLQGEWLYQEPAADELAE